MSHRIRFLVILLSLLVSCKSIDLFTPQNDKANEGEISLQLEVISQTLAEGERFEIQLKFINHSNSKVSIIRPLDGSWDNPPFRRQPYYIVEMLDENNQLVPNPFGAQLPRNDGFFNSLNPDDIYNLAPGESVQVINEGAFLPYQQVQSTARPGKYRVRVRYMVDAIPEATSLALVSNEANITINGGDQLLWQCYQDQLHLQQNHSFSTAYLGNLLPFESGYLLIYEKYNGKFVEGKSGSIGELYLQQLNEYGELVGNELLLVKKLNFGNIEAINIPNGILVVFTPSDVGSRSVETMSISFNEGVFRPGKLQVISPPPGDPYFIGLAVYEDVVGLAYRGNEQEDEALVFQLLDLQGTPLGQPRYIADTTWSKIKLQTTPNGFLLGWTAERDKIGLLHLDKAGQPIQPAQYIMVGDGMNLVNLGVTGNETYLVTHDSSLSGDNPNDTMGLYMFYLQKNGELVKPPIPLTPRTPDYPAFGMAVSIENVIGRIYEEDRHASISNNKLWFSIFLDNVEQSRTLLAETAGGIYELSPAANRFLVAWEDHRDDKSPSCTILGRCVYEIYISIFDNKRQQQVRPTRITQVAQPPPFLFGDYERFCQTNP